MMQRKRPASGRRQEDGLGANCTKAVRIFSPSPVLNFMCPGRSPFQHRGSRSAADLDRLETPAVPRVHALPHDVAAAVPIIGVIVIGVVGIVIGVVRIIVIVVIPVGSVEPGAKQRKPAPAMETAVPVSETAVSVPETTTCERNT